MSANASRYSHQRNRRYSQLTLSQGAMVTEADQREAQAIGLRTTTTLGDTSIRSGVPRTGGVLAYEVGEAPSAHRLPVAIRAGKVVADGHVAQVRMTDPDSPLEKETGWDLLHRQADLLDAPEQDSDGPYILYADIWHRHVGPAEDDRLVDPAFLSAETATRTETVAQLKLARTDDTLGTFAASVMVQDEGLPRYGDFRLDAVDFATEVTAPDICDPCATVLEDPNLDAGNALFRLEVHESAYNTPAFIDGVVIPADPATPRVTLKWSRDNGSLEYPLEAAKGLATDAAFETAVFEVTTLAGEQRLGLYTTRMEDRLSQLVARDDLAATLSTAPEGAIVRVWDGAVTIDLSRGDLDISPIGPLSATGETSRTGDTVLLKLVLGGLSLNLSARVTADHPFILPGDAWCVEIREYATDAGDKLIFQPEPVEIEHHYTFLGEIKDSRITHEDFDDTRARAFPALTELDALDIRYDNARSDAAAWTVQGALDLLFARPINTGDGDGCICTVMLDPNLPLDDQLADLAARVNSGAITDALICLPVGQYTMTKAVSFAGTGSLTFRGAGRDMTRIDVLPMIDTENDIPLEFTGFNAIRIEDMSIHATLTSSIPGAHPRLINGTDLSRLAVERCEVNVSRRETGPCYAITLMANPDTVPDGRDAAGTVLLRDSLLRLGTGAQAVMIYRAANALTVENCTFRANAVADLGIGRSLTGANDYLANVKMVPRTIPRERQISSGLYANFKGNDAMLLDLNGVDPALRETATAHVNAMVPLLGMEDKVSSQRAFATMVDMIGNMNEAITLLAGAETALRYDAPQVPTASGGPRMDLRRIDSARLTAAMRTATPLDMTASTRAAPITPDAFPILSALGDTQDAAVLDSLAETGGRGTASMTNPQVLIDVAGGADIGDAASNPALAQAIAIIEKANGNLADSVGILDAVEALGPIIIAAPAADPDLPSVGITAFTMQPMELRVTGNQFIELDVACEMIAATFKRSDDDVTPPAHAAVLRDNTLIRMLRDETVLDTGTSQLPTVEVPPPHAMTFRGYHDLTVENNDLNQIKPASMKLKPYQALFRGNLAPDQASFTAIRVTGTIGPKLRVIGNSAFGFQHCVFCDGQPIRTDSNPPHSRPGFWVFRENSVFPIAPNNNEVPPTHAVEIPKTDYVSMIRLAVSMNHPPNVEYESL